MHEYSIVSALLDRVEEEAARQGATSVRRLKVQIGELSGVEGDLLASAFELARTGTICGEAEMEIVPVKACWVCPLCQQAIASGAALRCPQCDEGARLESGEEIILERIEMEVA